MVLRRVGVLGELVDKLLIDPATVPRVIEVVLRERDQVRLLIDIQVKFGGNLSQQFLPVDEPCGSGEPSSNKGRSNSLIESLLVRIAKRFDLDRHAPPPLRGSLPLDDLLPQHHDLVTEVHPVRVHRVPPGLELPEFVPSPERWLTYAKQLRSLGDRDEVLRARGSSRTALHRPKNLAEP